MAVWELLISVSDIWMIIIGAVFGIRFIRNHRNYLIGLEWLVMATSGTNFLIYGLIKAGPGTPIYHLAFFFDAFSRSIGFTLILALGLMKVTHRFHPPKSVDIALFALAAVLGFVLSEYSVQLGTAGKAFMLFTALAVSGFLFYFAARLWAIGERTHSIWIGVATVLNIVIASIYDFWHIPGDDANHTIFYTFALFTWGLAMMVVYYGYTAFDAHNKRVDALDSAAADRERSALR
ncbi:transporter [Gordonia sp. TBRC 11910]|uniref:Transporter n=1 Tax=Gordonia asplenii TaxID=2725283 RepID=A0A848KXM7_9ACTN|nr:transporter [Gordonia asplenii]NMO03504.1 transporter [Gordonia asplenii]